MSTEDNFRSFVLMVFIGLAAWKGFEILYWIFKHVRVEWV